jgi:hypothetical protein
VEEFQSINLFPFVLDVLERVKQLSRHRNIRFQVDGKNDLFVFIDPLILQNVIEGLLRNAIENTPDAGMIRLVVEQKHGNQINGKESGVNGKKVPDEKFRDKVYKTIEENLTTMKRELGVIPSRDEVVAILKEKFEKRVGKVTPALLNSEILEKMEELEAWMTSDTFLLKKTPRIPTGVKIREGVEVVYGLHKAKRGLIRTDRSSFGRKKSSLLCLLLSCGDWDSFCSSVINSSVELMIITSFMWAGLALSEQKWVEHATAGCLRLTLCVLMMNMP